MKLRIQFEGRAYEVDVDILDPGLPVNGNGNGNGHAAKQVPASVLRHRPPQRLPEDSSCRSPIAGRIAAIIGTEGQKVRRNQPVLVIEAMKMEVPIGPAVDGTVKTIRVEPGESVKTGQILFDLA